MLRCQPFLPLRHLQFLARTTTTSLTQRLFLSTDGLVTELGCRGLLADHTGSHAELTVFLKRPRVLYCGVDPTAGSLHVGNLLPLIMLLHFQLKGHQVIALLGGATALIGDPSGRDEERPIQAAEQVQENAAKIEKQLVHFFGNATTYAQKRFASTMHSQPLAKVLNNLDWWRDLTLVDFLRSTGKSVRLSSMLSKESVKSRMTSSSGISFAEFSYQLLQAHDFWHLYTQYECRIQVGGSDQWGNIVAGMDVIARRESDTQKSDGQRVHGITTPLLLSSSGQKFGKSTGNAVWLDREKTSVFDFYQFFFRTTDADVANYLSLFTLLDPQGIANVMVSHNSQPEKRLAQRVLANEVTEMIHGENGLNQAKAATSLLFDTELSNVRVEEVAEALKNDPRYHIFEDTKLLSMPLTKLASMSGLTRSRAEAVRLVEAGGLYLNNVAVSGPDRKLEIEDLFEQRMAILRAGKDNHVILARK